MINKQKVQAVIAAACTANLADPLTVPELLLVVSHLLADIVTSADQRDPAGPQCILDAICAAQTGSALDLLIAVQVTVHNIALELDQQPTATERQVH